MKDAISFGFWCAANILTAVACGILALAVCVFALFDFLDGLIEPDERGAHLLAGLVCLLVAALLGWSVLLARRALGRKLGWLGTGD